MECSQRMKPPVIVRLELCVMSGDRVSGGAEGCGNGRSSEKQCDGERWAHEWRAARDRLASTVIKRNIIAIAPACRHSTRRMDGRWRFSCSAKLLCSGSRCFEQCQRMWTLEQQRPRLIELLWWRCTAQTACRITSKSGGVITSERLALVCRGLRLTIHSVMHSQPSSAAFASERHASASSKRCCKRPCDD